MESAAAVDPFELADRACSALAESTGVGRHDVAVVLGSGWRPAADRLGSLVAEVPVTELPGFPAATVSGHAGTVRSLRTPAGRRVLVFLGRVHGYEGHPPSVVVHGVRTACQAGCGVVVLTNAAGGIRQGMRVGQPVLIGDHLNLTARSPLEGPEPARVVPPRFVDLSDTYSSRLRALARSVDPSLEDGVYAALPGPHYETPAEIGMIRAIGGDLVGMSTTLEAIAAREAGMEVLGISLVTNLAAGISGQPLNHEEVLEAGKAAASRMGELLGRIVPKI
jgi:purine-nucleoside phosphorylase